MHPEVQKLLAVQTLDQKIARVREDLDSVPRERAAREAELTKLRTRHADAQARMQGAEVAVRGNQKALEEGDHEIKKLQERLNVVKNNAEYQAILLQIESVKRQIGVSEDEGVALLETVENVREELAKVTAELAEAESVFEEFLAKGQVILDERGGQVAVLDSERAALIDGISPELLGRYEQLFDARSNLVVCSVEGETCTGCYSSIPPNLQAKLHAGNAVVKCDSCQRILYYAE